MEIIRQDGDSFEFIVLRSFHWKGRPVAPTERREIERQEAFGAEIAGLVNSKRIKPVYPAEVECVALKTFSMPGNSKKFECKQGERILIRGEDLLPLILGHLCLPADPAIWRPLASSQDALAAGGLSFLKALMA